MVGMRNGGGTVVGVSLFAGVLLLMVFVKIFPNSDSAQMARLDQNDRLNQLRKDFSQLSDRILKLKSVEQSDVQIAAENTEHALKKFEEIQANTNKLLEQIQIQQKRAEQTTDYLLQKMSMNQEMNPAKLSGQEAPPEPERRAVKGLGRKEPEQFDQEVWNRLFGSLAAGSSQEDRRTAVKTAMQHAWRGYKQHAWGYDELRPNSKEHTEAQFGLTIISAMDTLYMMGLQTEFREAMDWVCNSLNWDLSFQHNAFEAVIRMLGGLMAAYELSGEQHQCILDKAQEFGDRLMDLWDVASGGLPDGVFDFVSKSSSKHGWSAGKKVLAEVSSVQLEFRALSRHTCDHTYDRAGAYATEVLEAVLPPDGLGADLISDTNEWGSRHVTVGARGDSFYEYLLKQYIMTNKTSPRYYHMFEKAALSIQKVLVKKTIYPQERPYTYVVDIDNYGTQHEVINHRMDHVTCFIGGMYALAAYTMPSPHIAAWLDLAKEITYTCRAMQEKTVLGLGPEIARFSNDSNRPVAASVSHYILRPEIIESYFYLWKVTKDPTYREYGWAAFQAIEKHCRIPSGGYAGVRDVDGGVPNHDDHMQSFFLSETLKYAYMLFSADDIFDLNGSILTTESHPLKVQQNTYRNCGNKFGNVARKKMERIQFLAQLRAQQGKNKEHLRGF